jgi:hypothetical protein
MMSEINNKQNNFWPRIIFYEVCWNSHKYFITVDSTEKFVEVLSSSIGDLGFHKGDIKKEVNKIISSKDYTDKPCYISSEVDDNGGLYCLLPASIDTNVIWRIDIDRNSDDIINIWERMSDAQYEDVEGSDKYHSLKEGEKCKI